ncbi:hypothetical protein MTR67_007159 [Solanum verrucosum]|uniref:Tf2-1-like SH3-like domain-containing protein n=1 Tax=Solanum verrucosum TaxID=315347 RepID=A0AAF0Q5K5_SOLVR|nr:hypothetical protein MTR67_007159 [Solanum verrucosum]
MLRQAVTNQVGQQKGARPEVADTSRIREFLRMNPPSFTGSSTTEDPDRDGNGAGRMRGGAGELEFEVDDWVYLKVSPMKGVMRFGKKGKLSPRYVGPYKISKRIDIVAYSWSYHKS